MEFKYDDLVKGFIYSFFGSTNPCVQITEEYIEYVDTCIRNKMGGDEGIHLVVSPEQDPLIQEGVNL